MVMLKSPYLTQKTPTGLFPIKSGNQPAQVQMPKQGYSQGMGSLGAVRPQQGYQTIPLPKPTQGLNQGGPAALMAGPSLSGPAQRGFGNDALPGSPQGPLTPSGPMATGGMGRPMGPPGLNYGAPAGSSGPSFTWKPGENKSPFNIPTGFPHTQAEIDAAKGAATSTGSAFDSFMAGLPYASKAFPPQALALMKQNSEQMKREADERNLQGVNWTLTTDSPESQFARYQLAASLGVGSADLFRQLQDLQGQTDLASQAAKLFGARLLS